MQNCLQMVEEMDRLIKVWTLVSEKKCAETEPIIHLAYKLTAVCTFSGSFCFLFFTKAEHRSGDYRVDTYAGADRRGHDV